MINNFYLHRIKKSNGVFDKGIEVKDSYADAKQAYHAYLGAWAYGHDSNTEFVQCLITDSNTTTPLMGETWIAEVNPEE